MSIKPMETVTGPNKYSVSVLNDFTIAFIFPEIYDTTPNHRGFVFFVNEQGTLQILKIIEISKSSQGDIYKIYIGDIVQYHNNNIHIFQYSSDPTRLLLGKKGVKDDSRLKVDRIYGLDLKKSFFGLRQTYKPAYSIPNYFNRFTQTQTGGGFESRKPYIILSDGKKHAFRMNIQKVHKGYSLLNIEYQKFNRDTRVTEYNVYYFLNNEPTESNLLFNTLNPIDFESSTHDFLPLHRQSSSTSSLGTPTTPPPHVPPRGSPPIVELEIDSKSTHIFLRHFLNKPLLKQFRDQFIRLYTRRNEKYEKPSYVENIKNNEGTFANGAKNLEFKSKEDDAKAKATGSTYVIYIDDNPIVNRTEIRPNNIETYQLDKSNGVMKQFVVENDNVPHSNLYTIGIPSNQFGGITTYFSIITHIIQIILNEIKKYKPTKIIFKFDFDCTLVGSHLFATLISQNPKFLGEFNNYNEKNKHSLYKPDRTTEDEAIKYIDNDYNLHSVYDFFMNYPGGENSTRYNNLMNFLTWLKQFYTINTSFEEYNKTHQRNSSIVAISRSPAIQGTVPTATQRAVPTAAERLALAEQALLRHASHASYAGGSGVKYYSLKYFANESEV